jgi:hypothetical protein
MGDIYVRNALAAIRSAVEYINTLPLEQKVEALNAVREELHRISPFRHEPVDLVLWVKSGEGNDYNPNKVAPPEMRLLEHSILEDGYTQPIVAHFEEGERVAHDQPTKLN